MQLFVINFLFFARSCRSCRRQIVSALRRQASQQLDRPHRRPHFFRLQHRQRLQSGLTPTGRQQQAVPRNGLKQVCSILKLSIFC